MKIAQGIWALLGATAVGAGIYLSRLNSLNNNLEILQKTSIHKVDFSGITLRIDVRMQNPTKGSISLKFPTVRLYHEKTLLTASAVQNKDFTIPQYGETVIDPIYLTLKVGDLIALAPSLMASIRKDGTMTLSAKTLTLINNAIPYEKPDSFTLTVPAALRNFLQLTSSN